MIEVAPLAYMRGRTLDDSFIILDEAQIPSGADENVSYANRFGSKAVITVILPDRPSGEKSQGLLRS